jgi:glutamine cyclotransferase
MFHKGTARMGVVLVQSCCIRRIGGRLFCLCSGLIASGCYLTCAPVLPDTEYPPPDRIIYYGYEVVHAYRHDPAAFTQGLVFANGFLYEGTGMHGASTIRKVSLETGEVLQKQSLASAYFGEGIAVHGGRLIQLTWKSQTGFVYDLETFQKTGDFGYLGEGWGLTHDGKKFIMSDGSAKVRFLDNDTFQQTGIRYIRFGETPVKRINELEYAEGKLYANIWRENRIALIDPDSGYVTGWIDLAGLLTAEEARNADVLNGIAWDAGEKRLFVTGKNWPKLFEIRLVEQRSEPYPASKIQP